MLTIRRIDPRLIPHPIREPPVRASHRHVHDQIKRPIERRRVRAVEPRVRRLDRRRAVRDIRGKVPAREERLVERDVQHVVQPIVDVDPQKLVCPFERVRVEGVAEVGSARVPPSVRLRDAVQPRERAPVE